MEPFLDPESFELFKAGDASVFNWMVYPALEDEIYQYSYKLLNNGHDAEDVTAMSFAKLWKERAALKKVEDIRRHLYTNARQISSNLLRTRGRVIYDESLLEDWVHDDTVSMLERLEARVPAHIVQALKSGMDELASMEREILILNDIRGIPMKEVADLLRIKLYKAYRLRTRALGKIRKALISKGLIELLKK